MNTLIAVCALFAATSTPNGFTDNLDEALQRADKSGKYVFACFSGSDWCGWCKKLEGEVFAKPAFLAGVTNDYELVYIDSPRDKSVLSEHAKAENPKLKKKYDIHGFPTALVLNTKGEPIARTGYRSGGPEGYVKHLLEFRDTEYMALVKKYVESFGTRQEAIMQELDATCREFADKKMKEEGMSREEARNASIVCIPPALAKLKALLAEEEALGKVPAKVAVPRAAQIAELKNYIEMLSGVGAENNAKPEK